MRRPEGFDRSAGERTPPPERSRGRARAALLDAPGTESTETTSGSTAETGPGDERATRSRPSRPPRPERVREPRVDRGPSAKAQLRAAARERRREEKAEIRRFTRRNRRRRIAALSAAGVVVLLVVMIVSAVYSPLLALRHIDVQGTSRLDAAQVRGAVDGQLGRPLALLDEKRMKRELGEFPLVRSYATEIVPPDTLVIRIVERTPVAVLEDASGYEAVDAAGVPVATSASRPPTTPLIELPPGKGVDGAAFQAMAGVLAALPPELVARIDTVTATTSDDVAFTIRDTGQTVVWGSVDAPAAKLQTLTHMPEWVANRAGKYSVASSGTATFTAS